MNTLGIFHSYSDPSAALVRDGKIVAFVEEERLVRVKHAVGYFPTRAIQYVLDAARLSIKDIDYIVQGWECNIYDSGKMAAVYNEINSKYHTTDADRAYQERHLETLSSTTQKGIILRNLRKQFGDLEFPPIVFVNHHLAHACMAFFHSGMDEALVLTIDGSGECVTTCWWLGRDRALEVLHEVRIPYSLGWFYSAFTEYLGFKAYDGEYKVMGLAAYGRHDPKLREKITRLVWYDGNGGFETDPLLLTRGERRFSYYYPDALVEYLGREPRLANEEITQWHMNLAFEVQTRLETVVQEMVNYWAEKTGLRRLVIGGGVGLNVKMNGKVFMDGLVDDIYVHPLCADNGIPIGAAMVLQYSNGCLFPTLLRDIYYGPSYSEEEIEKVLKACKLRYSREKVIEKTVAQLLEQGKIVAWYQGNLEGGPRALGNRSILADPRDVKSRDRVNAAIKFREFWRPFCPSMTENGARRYLEKYTYSPFMIMAFRVKRLAEKEIPAVVHVDGSTRPQIVYPDTNPQFHRLIGEFEKLTGVPCLLNTSFNIKEEPIVCSPHDAIRTFSATGLDALAIGPFLLTKDGG